jgi:ribosomal protein L7/L12/outer membrane protein assembly factor BamB
VLEELPMLETFSCPSCNASLEVPDPPRLALNCPYCGSTVFVPDEVASGGRAGTPSPATAEISRLLQAGRKIEAIKLYRATFNVGLREAKDAVEQMERGPTRPEVALPGMQPLSSVTAEISRLLQAGQRIEAIKLYLHSYNVGLKEAKDAVDLMEGRRAGLPGTAAMKKRGGSSCLVMLALIVLLVAGLGAALYYLLQGPALQQGINTLGDEVALRKPLLNGASLLVPGVDGAPADLLFMINDTSVQELSVAYYEGNSGTRRWRNSSITGLASGTEFYAQGDHIYAVTEAAISALSQTDGATLWQSRLADRLPYNCQDCLLGFGDQLVVLTLDGYAQGVAVADGSLSWRHRLEGANVRRLFRLDGNVAAMSDSGTAGRGLIILDPATGDPVRWLLPRCERGSGGFQEPSLDDPLIVDQARGSLIIVFGFFDPACAQRFNFETGDLLWSTFADFGATSGSPALSAGDRIYLVVQGDTLYSISKEDGAAVLLNTADDYELLPLDSAANILLLQATRQRGSRHDELWAVDGQNGDILWRHVPQADERLADGDSTAVFPSDEGYWSMRLTPGGVNLLQVRQQPARLVFETLDLLSGASSGQTELPLTGVSDTSFWFQLLGWEREQVWLKVDLRQIWAVDPLTAEIAWRFP